MLELRSPVVCRLWVHAVKWGALAEKPSCGRGRCFVHRVCNDVVREKWFSKQFEIVVSGNYTPEELGTLRSVANGMG